MMILLDSPAKSKRPAARTGWVFPRLRVGLCVCARRSAFASLTDRRSSWVLTSCYARPQLSLYASSVHLLVCTSCFTLKLTFAFPAYYSLFPPRFGFSSRAGLLRHCLLLPLAPPRSPTPCPQIGTCLHPAMCTSNSGFLHSEIGGRPSASSASKSYRRHTHVLG